jgi:hypothetical protein
MDWFTKSVAGKSPDPKTFSLLPSKKTLASMAMLSTSFFAFQNVAQRLVGRVGLFAGGSLPVTTSLGLLVTTTNMYASNLITRELEQVWDAEVEPLPFSKGRMPVLHLNCILIISLFVITTSECFSS